MRTVHTKEQRKKETERITKSERDKWEFYSESDSDLDFWSPTVILWSSSFSKKIATGHHDFEVTAWAYTLGREMEREKLGHASMSWEWSLILWTGEISQRKNVSWSARAENVEVCVGHRKLLESSQIIDLDALELTERLLGALGPQLHFGPEWSQPLVTRRWGFLRVSRHWIPSPLLTQFFASKKI